LNTYNFERILFSQDLVRNLLAKAEKARLPLSIKTPLIFSLHHDLQVLYFLLTNYIVCLDHAKSVDQWFDLVELRHAIHFVFVWSTVNGTFRFVQLCFRITWRHWLFFVFGYSVECSYTECDLARQRFYHDCYDSLLLRICQLRTETTEQCGKSSICFSMFIVAHYFGMHCFSGLDLPSATCN
jgi:hypothetical protein